MTQKAPSSAPEPIAEARVAVRKAIVPAAVFSCFVNILMLTGPIYMLQMYDRVLLSRSIETLVVITGLTVVLFVAMGLLDYARGALLARSGAQFEGRLKPLVFNLSMNSAHKAAIGADQPMRDLRQVRQFVASPALTAVFDAPWTPIFMGVIFLMHWALGMVAFVGLLVLMSLAIYNERSSRNANTKSLAITGEADRLAMSALRNAAAADAMGMRKTLRDRWMNISAVASDHNITATDTIGGLTAASKASRMFLQSAILGMGAFLAIQGEVTPGVMIAASIIAGRALSPIEIVTSQWKNFAQTSIAFKRLEHFIAGAPKEVERTELPAPKGALFVDRLYCQPEGSPKLIIKNVTFKIAPGETIGVIGPSAAGKSTLSRALVGVEPVKGGDIRLDGASLSQWDPDQLGPYVGYLPQDVELFSGTAAQNIARFAPEPDPAKIIAAAKAAGAHEMILSFVSGYDTEIAERGAHISAGQRQRLGLARALYGDPSLVILDEPNSNLDGEGDAALAEAVKRLKARGATTIVISHRPSAIAYVDKLLLLVDGEVRAFGPRDEILQRMAPQQVATIHSQDGQKGQDEQKGGASGAA